MVACELVGPGGEPRSFEQVTRWERATLRPHYGLPLGVESTLYLDTIEPLDYGLFFLPWTLEPEPGAAARLGMEAGQKVWYYPRRGFDLWNTRYFIVPAKLVWESAARGYGAVIPNSTFVYPPLGAFEGRGRRDAEDGVGGERGLPGAAERGGLSAGLGGASGGGVAGGAWA